MCVLLFQMERRVFVYKHRRLYPCCDSIMVDENNVRPKVKHKTQAASLNFSKLSGIWGGNESTAGSGCFCNKKT